MLGGQLAGQTSIPPGILESLRERQQHQLARNREAVALQSRLGIAADDGFSWIGKLKESGRMSRAGQVSSPVSSSIRLLARLTMRANQATARKRPGRTEFAGQAE